MHSVLFTARSLTKMKKIKILFQGDSITDAGRDRRNYYDLGPGYARYVADLLKERHADAEFEFINLGISGNRTGELFDRLYSDAISLQPDVISILIGINDVWHREPPLHIYTTDEQIELNYREILKRIKKETKAKILILAPYVLDAEDKVNLRKGLETVLPIIEGLAKEYADAYVPLDVLFAKALETQPVPMYYSPDGVHPNDNGAKFIAKHYAEAIEKILS